MSGDNDSYNGHDELTGLHDSVYFSLEFDRVKAILRRTGESKLLLYLHLHEATPEDKVKDVAEYWQNAFNRTCRYEKKDYSFLALHKDASDPKSKEQEVLDALVSTHPELIIRIDSIVVNGASGSLDELAAELAK